VAFVGTKSDKSVRRTFHFEDVSLRAACCFKRQKDKLPDRHVVRLSRCVTASAGKWLSNIASRICRSNNGDTRELWRRN